MTSAGMCQGSVLSFCFDGTLASVDCALSGEICGTAAPSAGSVATPGATDPPAASCQPAPKPAISVNLPAVAR